MNWYASPTGNHQGLVIDEATGDNIAITYKKENAPLVAAAPDLLNALKMAEGALSAWIDQGNKNIIPMVQHIRTIIREAEEG